MTINLNLLLSEHVHISWLHYDHTFSLPVRSSVPVPEKGATVHLPLGLSLVGTEEGTSIHIELEESGLIPLLEYTLNVGGSKTINLEPFPGFHITGTISVTE